MELNNNDLAWVTRKHKLGRDYDGDVIVKLSHPANGSMRVVMSFKAEKAEDAFTMTCLRESCIVYAIKKNRIYFAEVSGTDGYTLSKSGKLRYIISRRIDKAAPEVEFVGQYELKWSEDRELWYIEKEARIEV